MFDNDKNISGNIINWAIENGSEGKSTDGEKIYQSDMQLVFGFEDGGSGNEHDDAKVIIDFLIEDGDAYLPPQDGGGGGSNGGVDIPAKEYLDVTRNNSPQNNVCIAGFDRIVNKHPTKTIEVWYTINNNPQQYTVPILPPNGYHQVGCSTGAGYNWLNLSIFL